MEAAGDAEVEESKASPHVEESKRDPHAPWTTLDFIVNGTNPRSDHVKLWIDNPEVRRRHRGG